ncbi:MAG: hypothetical protein AB7W06_23335 [Alphaproteobacteria bacterium]
MAGGGMAPKFWQGIASLFGRARRRNGTGAGSGRAARRRSGADFHAGAQALAIASYRDAIDAGKLHLLNLGTIRDELGERWPMIEARVSAAIERILRQRLGIADQHYRLNETSYVLILDSATPADGRMLCGLIASEIRHKLFGEERELSAIEVTSAVVKADGTIDFVPVDAAAAVIDALSKGIAAESDMPAPVPGDIAAPDPPAADPPAESWQPIEHRPADRSDPAFLPIGGPAGSLDAVVKSIEREIGAGFDPMPAPARRLYDPVKAAEEQNAAARRMAALQAMVQSQLPGDAPAPGAAIRSGQDLSIDSLRFAYQPVWDCDRHVVTSYGLQVKVEAGGRLKPLAEIERQVLRPDAIASIDLLAVRKAAADLQTMLSRGSKAIISVPIHRAVLDQSAKRDAILTLLSQQPRHVRRLLQIEILDAHAGDWAVLPALLALCRRVSRETVLRLDLDETDMARPRAAGFRTVGSDLRDHPGPEAAAMRKMESFAAAADEARLASYLTGLDKTSSVVAAVCAGFQLVAGTAVAPEVEFPTGVYLFDTINLFLRKRSARDRA